MTIYKRNNEKLEYDQSQDQFLKHLYGSLSGRLLLKFLTKPSITKMGGLFMNSVLSKGQIHSFVKKNNIDLSLYEDRDYHSYNDFFTRRLKEGVRSIDHDPRALIAPCDSKLTVYPISESLHLQIKNSIYSLDDLLMSPGLADAYQGGLCLVFRLTVDDYHHYHYIDDGFSDKEHFIKGIFHTVNPIASEYYPIYKTNSRAYTVLHTQHFGDVLQMEVGAMMVGKITNLHKKTFQRGEEKGYFEFGGSTVILLIKKDVVEIDEDILQHSKNEDEVRVLMGERIGTLKK